MTNKLADLIASLQQEYPDCKLIEIAAQLQRKHPDEIKTLDDLTVLGPQVDPLRIALNPLFHFAARWLLACIRTIEKIPGIRFRDANGDVHIRGIHYAIAMALMFLPFSIKRIRTKGKVRKFKNLKQWVSPPDQGDQYVTSNNDHWTFTQSKAAKALRWLGFDSWDGYKDRRNKDAREVAPERATVPEVEISLHGEATAEHAAVWSAIQLPPRPALPNLPKLPKIKSEYWLYADFTGEAHQPQRFRLWFWTEKEAANEDLTVRAILYKAAFYPTTGECSDIKLYDAAQHADADGRETVMICFSDADPPGYQMITSIAHKTRWFKELEFPDLRFRVIQGALRPDQVKTLRPKLPEAPLGTNKAVLKKNEAWVAAFDIGQTELDAIANQPARFKKLIDEAIRPYFDPGLADRVREADEKWRDEVQETLDDYPIEVEADQDEIDLIASHYAKVQRAHELLKRRWDDAAIQAAHDAYCRALAPVIRPYRLLDGRIDALNAALDEAADRRDEAAQERADTFDTEWLPELVLPECEAEGSDDNVVVTSDLDLIDHILTLKARKSFDNGEDEGGDE